MRAQMELALRFVVRDDPEAPGGKSGFPIYRGSKKKGNREFTGRVAIADKNSKSVALWRESVMSAARPNHVPLISPALQDDLVVKYYFTIGKPSSVNLDKRPYPNVRPDWDNLIKPTQDAITVAGLWHDDSRIITGISSKAYVGGYHPDGTPAESVPGCVIEIFKIVRP